MCHNCEIPLTVSASFFLFKKKTARNLFTMKRAQCVAANSPNKNSHSFCECGTDWMHPSRKKPRPLKCGHVHVQWREADRRFSVFTMPIDWPLNGSMNFLRELIAVAFRWMGKFVYACSYSYFGQSAADLNARAAPRSSSLRSFADFFRLSCVSFERYWPDLQFIECVRLVQVSWMLLNIVGSTVNV